MEDRQNQRLDSWKVIAGYLRRDTRTVMRWERKGLPVYRVPGGQRNAVFAFKAEIDAWMTGGGIAAAEDPGPAEEMAGSHLPVGEPMEAAATTTHPAKAAIGNKWRWAAIAAVVILLLGAGSRIVKSWTAPRSLRVLRIEQLTNDDHLKDDLVTDGSTVYYGEHLYGHLTIFAVPAKGGDARQVPAPFANAKLGDISKDGKNLLLLAPEGMEVELPLWVVPTSGGPAHELEGLRVHDAKWSPDGHAIAYASGRAIYVADREGQHSREVSLLRAPARRLLWSPNGEQLRFLLREPSTLRLSAWEVSIDEKGAPTSQPIRQSFLGDCCDAWSWTSDGAYLLFTTVSKDHVSPLWALQAGRSSWLHSSASMLEFPVRPEVAMNFTTGNQPRKIFMVAGGPTHVELLELDPRTREFSSYLRGISATYAAFSRDGEWVAYMKMPEGTLWRSRADGSDALRLTFSPEVVNLPSWSPDGNEIAYTSQTPGKPWRIHLISRDGGQPREAASGDENAGAPTWSPDGGSLVYADVLCQETHSCAVHELNLATNKIETLPGSQGLRTARWSPDGRYVAALQPENHQVLLYEVRSQHWRILSDSIHGDNLNWSHDSRYLYADETDGDSTTIVRLRASDGNRKTVLDSAELKGKMEGRFESWFGLAPDDSLIVERILNATEVYSLDWTDQ